MMIDSMALRHPDSRQIHGRDAGNRLKGVVASYAGVDGRHQDPSGAWVVDTRRQH